MPAIKRPAKPVWTIYPDPRAAAICGGGSGFLTRAVERWARALQDAEDRITDLGLVRSDWNYLADVVAGMPRQPEWFEAVVDTAIADAHRLEQLGVPHYGPADADARVEALRERFHTVGREEDDVRLNAIITAVEWYLAHRDSIDAATDDWWTVEFRCRRQLGGGAAEGGPREEKVESGEEKET